MGRFKMRKATMQDIADELKLSRNTISRAMRGKNGVSEATKRQIAEVAKRIGYEYKESINGKKKNEQRHFALLASSFALSQISFFGIILEALKDIVYDNDYSMEIFEVSRDDKENQESILEKLSSENEKYNGLFILSHITEDFINSVIKLDYPTILIDHHSPKLKADAVITQNEFGTYELVEHLIKNNHSEIGFIGNTTLSPSYRERYIGYEQALQDHHIEPNQSFILTDVEEEQKALFDRISQLDKLPDSWFCVNSGLAFILNTYIHSKGYSVPEDISIVCFDDTEFSRQSSPPITCVGTDLKLVAKLSYQTMKQRLSSPDDSFKEVRILPEFYERSSVKLK